MACQKNDNIEEITRDNVRTRGGGLHVVSKNKWIMWKKNITWNEGIIWGNILDRKKNESHVEMK